MYMYIYIYIYTKTNEKRKSSPDFPIQLCPHPAHYYVNQVR